MNAKTQPDQKAPKLSWSRRNEVHLLRKIWHMGTGLLGLFIFFKLEIEARKMAIVLFGLGVTGLITDLLRINIPAFQKKLNGSFRYLMRESERTSITGFPYYAFGTSFSLFFYETKIAVLSVLYLVFADPISSLIGVLYGKDKILPNKSVQGSVAGFIVCYLLTLVYGMAYGAFGLDLLIFSIVGGIIGSLSELLSIKIDDNLVIPVASGAGLTLLNFFVPVFS